MASRSDPPDSKAAPIRRLMAWPCLSETCRSDLRLASRADTQTIDDPRIDQHGNDRMTLSQTDGDFLTLHELIRAASRKLDRNNWDYLIGGTETETTLLRNRQALDRIAFRPRVLRDVSSIDPSHSFVG